MSFISENATARTYAPGYFLVNNEDCTRETVQVSASDGRAVSQFGGKFVPMGTILPANGATAKGILYEDVDVSEGNAAGSLVTSGVVYEDYLPEVVDSDAKTALAAAGIKFVAAPSVTRP